jgi:hypothetical protein
MKTSEEWVREFYDFDHTRESTIKKLRDFVSEIQSDAFHAGQLMGLDDARSIVEQWSPSETSPCGRSVKEISIMRESLEKK